MKRGVKIILTEEQERWLVKHFKHTSNAECASRLNISSRTVTRIARELDLHKTPQFMRKWSSIGLERAHESHRINGTYPPKGFHIPNSEKHQFKPGVSSLQRIGKKKEAQRIEKCVATRLKTIKSERARIVFGLPQRTNLKLVHQDPKRRYQRWYLKQRGYTLNEDRRIAYYDEDTRRSPKLEATSTFYKFAPISEANRTYDAPVPYYREARQIDEFNI